MLSTTNVARQLAKGYKTKNLDQLTNFGRRAISIERMHTTGRMSQMVVSGNTMYLAGRISSGAPGLSVAKQTEDILNRIDTYLAEAGTNKMILLTGIAKFAEMNTVWDAWVTPGNTPCRACVEAKLASDKYDVEIMVTAAR